MTCREGYEIVMNEDGTMESWKCVSKNRVDFVIEISCDYTLFLSLYWQLKESLAGMFGIDIFMSDYNKMTIRFLTEGSTIITGSVNVQNQE